MSDDLLFAASRLKEEAGKSNNMGNLLTLVGNYIHAAIDAGFFSGIRFVEFRKDVTSADPTKISPIRIVMGLDWLSKHAKSASLPYAELLPALLPRSGGIINGLPGMAIVVPHVEALAALLEHLGSGTLRVIDPVFVTNGVPKSEWSKQLPPQKRDDSDDNHENVENKLPRNQDVTDLCLHLKTQSHLFAT